MTIYREGKAIELTAEEIRKIRKADFLHSLRIDAIDKIHDFECESWFNSFAEHGFDSFDSFESAFTAKVAEEAEELITDYDYSRSCAIEEAVDLVRDEYDLEYPD